MAQTCNLNFPIFKVGNWIGRVVDAATKKVKTDFFDYHGKLIKLAGGIFHARNHLADARIEILVYLAVKEKVPMQIIMKLSQANTVEEGILLLEEYSESIADKLFNKLSTTVEERSLAYVNRYIKTEMKIAAVIFDKHRKIRWSALMVTTIFLVSNSITLIIYAFS